MYNLLCKLLIKHNIDLFAPVALRNCQIKKGYLLERAKISDGTVIVMAVPYLSREAFFSERNVSLYAAPRDYHLFFEDLFDEILPILQNSFPNNKFAAFADHSPIDEVDTALKAGLGILGDNGMLITKEYSSFVFLGEIITDMNIPTKLHEIKRCEGCGKCSAACKGGSECKKDSCISHLSQSKGEITQALRSAITASGLVWGCDDCSLACPHTKEAIRCGSAFTNINFFNTDIIPYLTSELLNRMSDGDFAKRAYSWRKKDVVLRNVKEFEDINEKGRNGLC